MFNSLEIFDTSFERFSAASGTRIEIIKSESSIESFSVPESSIPYFLALSIVFFERPLKGEITLIPDFIILSAIGDPISPGLIRVIEFKSLVLLIFLL